MTIVYGSLLVVLGCWATFTIWKTLSSPDWRTQHRAIVILGVLFAASCWLPGFTLLASSFKPWMLVPLGVCFVVLIPFPCYFKRANRGWIVKARTVLFLLVGGGLVAAGFGRLPLSWFGL